MTKSILIALLVTLSSTQAFATGDSTKSRITEAYLLGGGYSGDYTYLNLSQYQALNPDSKILQSNFSGFSSNTITRYNDASMLYMAVGYKMKQQNAPVLRFGLGVGSGNSIQGGYYKEVTTHLDTLVSPRTGAKAYVDSIYNEGYDFSTRSDMVQLDASAIWRTRNPNRITLFGGIGVFAGTSFNVFSTISHYSSSYIISPDPSAYNSPGHHSYYDNFKSDNETFKNKSHSVYGVYIPFGIDMRLGKKSTFWKHFHLVFEARVRMQKYNFGGIGSQASTPYNGLFGIRYKFSQ